MQRTWTTATCRRKGTRNLRGCEQPGKNQGCGRRSPGATEAAEKSSTARSACSHGDIAVREWKRRGWCCAKAPPYRRRLGNYRAVAWDDCDHGSNPIAATRDAYRSVRSSAVLMPAAASRSRTRLDREDPSGRRLAMSFTRVYEDAMRERATACRCSGERPECEAACAVLRRTRLRTNRFFP